MRNGLLEKVQMNAAKIEIQKQWDTDPCGATTSTQKIGSLAFYREVRAYRFGQYAPWLGKTVSFSNWQDMDILEIGPGLGSDHYLFAEQGNRMITVDLTWAHLQHTRNHLNLEKLKTRPVLADAETLPFGTGRFDLVYAFGVLHHTPETFQASAEIHRVLKPGGTAIVVLYHRDSLFFWIKMLLMRGLLLGGLWRQGWRRFMANIEFQSADNDALPIVKVYSRRQARRLFSMFSSRKIIARHIYAERDPIIKLLLKLFGREDLERLLGWGGAYLVIHAQK